MASAAILSLEEFRDGQRRTEVRQRLHDRFDAWLNRLKARMEDRTPTLEALTQAVFALRQELTHAVTAGLEEQAHRWLLAQHLTACPCWGQTLAARGPQERPVATLVGSVQMSRPRWY